MGTCRWTGALAAVTLTVSGCGAAARGPSSPADALRALAPRTAPNGWLAARTPSGAVLFRPPRWRQIAGDPGSVSAAIEDRGGLIVGYLNITPRQPPETTSSWGAFRVAHNRDEGNRDVRLQASARGVRLRDGRGSCVRDSYTTVTRVRYTEIACLLAGPRRSSVIVAAASAAAWARLSPTLERALGSAIT